MVEKILDICIKNGFLVDKDILNIFNELNDVKLTEIILESIKKEYTERILTRNFFNSNKSRLYNSLGNKSSIVEKLFLKLGVSLEITKEVLFHQEEIVPLIKSSKENIKILKSYNFNPKKIEVEDFVKSFRVRYNDIRKILQEHVNLENLTSIGKISSQKQGISIIGFVYDKRITKNKNIILVVEDLTGRISVLINKDREDIYEKARNVIIDDIVGIKCSGNREFLFANDIIFPNCYLSEKKFLERDEIVAFTSDIHIGSKNFLENNFLRFIDWLNGKNQNYEQLLISQKVKYLFIVGDTVDGVGIYPSQEKELVIKDIKLQYNLLAEYLSRIRKDITIILCPGQHDCVIVAEPQPVLDPTYSEAMYKLDNLILVSNPALIEIKNETKKGIKILMYHGASFHSYIDELDHLRASKAVNNPTKISKEVLKRRHLSSIHGATSYTPYTTEDPLVISEVPDIFLTGDLHKPEIDMYNNILLVASSCWQSRTAFEEKVGNNPDPCKVPILNLKTRAIKILDFSGKEKENEVKIVEALVDGGNKNEISVENTKKTEAEKVEIKNG